MSQTMIRMIKELRGDILDIGGGGEGVIGRVYGPQVTAIDNRQEELDEAPEGFTKLLMDARQLDFPDACFDHVTAFYALMYMDRDAQAAALGEAARVLRPGGTLSIWDVDIQSASPTPFLTTVAVDIGGERLTPTYGIRMEQAAQNAATIDNLCQRAGLRLLRKTQQQEHFFLRYRKGDL